MFYLPTWLYEILPYVYIVVGALALIGVDITVGRLSGILLLTAAIVIIKMRRDCRNKMRERAH